MTLLSIVGDKATSITVRLQTHGQHTAEYAVSFHEGKAWLVKRHVKHLSWRIVWREGRKIGPKVGIVISCAWEYAERPINWAFA